MKRLTVKFLAKGPQRQDHGVWLRQFPGNSGAWGNCVFVFDPDAQSYDWLVVYDDLPRTGKERFSQRSETLRCRPENTLLVTTEPSSVKLYSAPYLAQFGHVLSSQEPYLIDHPNVIFSQPALHWFYGNSKTKRITYDQMKAAQPPEKPRLISTVCSSKQQKKTLHNSRRQFTEQLKKHIPELDHYGHGVRFLEEKAEALDPYAYHVAIENHICRHHWTEKLADPFLGFCLPFYFGCSNLDDYFPPDSYIPIDLFDVDSSSETIRAALGDNAYQKRLTAVVEARRRVLDEYNLFAVIANIVEQHHLEQSIRGKSNGCIMSRRAAKIKHPLKHILSATRQRIAQRRHKSAYL